MRSIPKALIFSRLILGFLILIISFINIPFYSWIACSLFITGFLTDIFDGIVARRLNCSTESLRRMDSNVDMAFFICCIIGVIVRNPDFFQRYMFELLLLVGLELLAYLVCFLRFRKEIATHSIGAKLWAISIFGTILSLMMGQNSDLIFTACFYIGIISRMEIIAILLLLRSWTNDVPGLYACLKIRKGKAIKRHWIFNG